MGSKSLSGEFGNAPVYDERGRRVWLKPSWRIPRRPFRAPICHRAVRRIGRNTWRCIDCAARIEPERLYHRLLLRWNPFGPTRVRDLFRVTRWRP